MPTLPRPFVIKRPCALSQHLAPFSFSVTWWEITMGGSGVHFLWLRGPSDPGVLWSGHLSSLSVFCLSRQPALWGAPFYSLDFLDLGASRQQTNFPKPDSVIFLDRRGSQEVGLFGTSKTQQTHSQGRSVIPQLLWQPNWVETEGNPGFWWGKWSTYLDMQGWEQLFSPGGSFVLQMFSHIWRLFCWPSHSGMVLLAPSGWKSGMLLHILQCTGQPFTTRNYPGPNVTSAKTSRSRSRAWVTVSYTLLIYADRYSQAALPMAGYLIRVRCPFCNYSFTHSPQGCSGGRCFDGSHLGVELNFGLFWTVSLATRLSQPSLWLGVKSRPGLVSTQ